MSKINPLPPGGKFKYEWRGRIPDEHGMMRQHRQKFATRREAAEYDATTRADIARGTWIDVTSKTTVAEYFRAWLDMRSLRPGTLKHHESVLRNHIAPSRLAHRPLVKVKHSEALEFARELSDSGLTAPVVRHYVGLLRSMFRVAMRDGHIAVNPVYLARDMSLPTGDRPKFIPLTPGQVQAMADAADPRVRPMIWLQAGTGLRISELRGLRVDDVEWLGRNRNVHVRQQLDRHGHPVELKTGNSYRTVELPDTIRDVLAAHLAAYPPGPLGLVFAPPPHIHELISTVPGTWNIVTLGKKYRAAAERAGLPEGTSSHDLRHFFASTMLAAGEPLADVAAWLGDTQEVTMRTYSHVLPNRHGQVRKVIDAAFGELAAGVPAAEEAE